MSTADQTPPRTGLELRDGKFVQACDPFYLAELEAFHGGQRVSRFVLTAARGDNPPSRSRCAPAGRGR